MKGMKPNTIKVDRTKPVVAAIERVTLTMDEDTAYAVLALVGNHRSDFSVVNTYNFFGDFKDAMGGMQKYTPQRSEGKDSVTLVLNEHFEGAK